MNALQERELQQAKKWFDIEQIETNEPKERFQIKDKEQLNWALRKLSALKAKEAETNELAEKEIERIREWQEAELKSMEDSVAYFESLITEYATKRREADPKYKSESTPFGRIGFRKQQPQYTYNDEEVITYLEQCGYDDLYRVKKEPSKADIKKRFVLHGDKLINPETGEEVPGIIVTEREDKLDIKVVWAWTSTRRL